MEKYYPLGCLDYKEWTKSFNKMLVKNGNQPYDPEKLDYWFSNAIMTGYKAGIVKQKLSKTKGGKL